MVTSLGFAFLSNPFTAAAAGPCFVSEAGLYIASEASYWAAVCPEEEYKEIVNPESCFVPELEEIPDGIGRDAAEIALNLNLV